MDLLRLEQQRQALEQSLQELRRSLKYWQTYEAELEGFKEEIQSVPGRPDFEKIRKTFNGDVMTEKEIGDLAGLSLQSPRTGEQVLGMISRRQDYVQKNIETVQRQFFDSEAKLEELDFMAFSSAHRDQDTGGLPLTEILEELDDEGNVISSSLSQPELNTTKLVEALRKAGLSEDDIQATAASDAEDAEIATPAMPRSALVEKPFKTTDSNVTSNGTHPSPERPPIRKKSVSFTVDTKPSPEPVRQNSEDGKKSVSFHDKVAVMPAAPPPDTRSVSFSPQVEEIPAEPIVASPEMQAKPHPGPQEALRGMMFKPGETVTEINEDEDPVSTHIVIPQNETEEDAKTRQEMLDYHLHEVGNIVAQLDIEEDDQDMDAEESTSASDFASDYPDDDTPYDTEDESEDEFGRTTRRVISDDYHQKMQELERRLIGNLGPTPDAEAVNVLDPNLDPSDVRRLIVREKRNSLSSTGSESEKKTNTKKRVSFAKNLDVAGEAAVPPTKAAKHEEGENAAPVSDIVSERTTATKAAEAPKSARLSRFKKQHAAPLSDDSNTTAFNHDSNGTPTGPAGKIIADSLLERPSPTRRNIAAPSSDDLDPIMQRRELAAEYYRRRNDMIRQQGGFKAQMEDDDDMGQWMEEKDGQLKKVSRFKAARIKPQ